MILPIRIITTTITMSKKINTGRGNHFHVEKWMIYMSAQGLHSVPQIPCAAASSTPLTSPHGFPGIKAAPIATEPMGRSLQGCIPMAPMGAEAQDFRVWTRWRMRSSNVTWNKMIPSPSSDEGNHGAVRPPFMEP